MSTLVEAFVAAIAQVPEASTRGLIAALGGGARGRSQLSRLRAGLPLEGPAPRKGTPEYTTYRTAQQVIRRYESFERREAGESVTAAVRRPDAGFIAAQRGRVGALATRRHVQALAAAKGGTRNRLLGVVRISDDVEERMIPPGPGQLVSKMAAKPWTDLVLRGDLGKAAAAWWQAVLYAYGLGGQEKEEDWLTLESVEWIRIWRDGDPEPR